MSLDGAQHGADDGAAEADEGDHDDEPADAHGLRHHEAAAGLGLLVAQVGGAAGGASGPGGGREGVRWGCTSKSGWGGGDAGASAGDSNNNGGKTFYK